MINYDKEKLNLDKITSNDLPYLENLLKRKWFAPINNTTDTTKEEFMNSCNKVMEKIQKGVEKNE